MYFVRLIDFYKLAFNYLKIYIIELRSKRTVLKMLSVCCLIGLRSDSKTVVNAIRNCFNKIQLMSAFGANCFTTKDTCLNRRMEISVGMWRLLSINCLSVMKENLLSKMI